jgi:hypothetical protein
MPEPVERHLENTRGVIEGLRYCLSRYLTTLDLNYDPSALRVNSQKIERPTLSPKLPTHDGEARLYEFWITLDPILKVTFKVNLPANEPLGASWVNSPYADFGHSDAHFCSCVSFVPPASGGFRVSDC